MICRNCNYILNGSEQFCPHCGANLPRPPKDPPENDATPKPPIFTSEKIWDETENLQPPNRIFLSSDEQSIPEDNSGKGKKVAVILSLSLLLILLCSGAFIMARRMDITPVLSAIISTKKEPEIPVTSALVTTTTKEIDKNFGIIPPEIIYEPMNCYVTGNSVLPLKKGPDDIYGQVTLISTGQQLQVVGGSVLEQNWLYVYIPSEDCYGWMKGAYLTQSQALEQVIINGEISISDESTETTLPGNGDIQTPAEKEEKTTPGE